MIKSLEIIYNITLFFNEACYPIHIPDHPEIRGRFSGGG